MTTDRWPPSSERVAAKLNRIDWAFANEKTTYLTHNIHPYPAKFIPQIPNALIRELSLEGESVADIFCGSGTTMLEAIRLGRNAIGVDANPLAGLITKVKTTPLGESGHAELEGHSRACQKVLGKAALMEGHVLWAQGPFISAGWRPEKEFCDRWFDPHIVEELAELLTLINELPSEDLRDIAKVTFSSIVVRVSKQDSDTRYVRREKNLKPGDAIRLYLRRLNSVSHTLRGLADVANPNSDCQVICADLLKFPETKPFDLVVTSPPYPNAYSYHLYHRTRLMWLGFDTEGFKSAEIGSHRKYSRKGKSRATPATFAREFESIFRWLHARLRDHRYACFVIGDSTIQGERIDNASLLAGAAFNAGFDEVIRLERAIPSRRKSFNPALGRINSEKILILQKQ